jgi:hypothetical protein
VRERRTLWRETPVIGGLLGSLLGGRSSPGAIDPRRFVTKARVFVLTDGGCASACLDAIDIWKPLGAVLIGRETSADSQYMEIRREPLPSGVSTVAVPMKVYRARARGNNQPYVPTHVFKEDWSDQAAVEAWVDKLR